MKKTHLHLRLPFYQLYNKLRCDLGILKLLKTKFKIKMKSKSKY